MAKFTNLCDTPRITGNEMGISTLEFNNLSSLEIYECLLVCFYRINVFVN